ncbi:adenylate/guanylate cyclase domain-containing protein [Dyadobacter sp. CY107]|uniref:adenylate/guanylate cyclase domain-containing protein n=1 Tax=Dyadobacter fanqingshengii TaxID=2906443 RepID=UPI001F2BF6BA|nr:adenylate/guanylate cyclase domain-containing protein [Dyadobacter fanqingshengii]MCF2505358.1 adenylate/guanylate cyclase domain-containing protein [Dyadobacter fanqingshengii]
MLSPKTKRDVARVIPFGVLWFIFSLIYCMLEKGILGDLDHYPSTGNQYKFAANIFAIPVAGLMMGLITGILEIGYFSKWFIKKSFTRKIVFKSFLYLIIVIIFLAFTLLMNALNMPSEHSFRNLVSPVWAFFTDYAAVGLVLYIASIILVTQFYAEFSQSLGPGTLSNFFLGKYHHPVEEERIFMFLDMKSSTTIAENLGHVRYFEMLKEYFFDLSGAVIDYAGTIYQYAGDEMIISWKLKDGLKNNNCIECFFAMKRILESQTEKYNGKFGILPAFKAGLHFGMVTAGEIGSLKKEIIFTGDVLNTSARIQGLCNHFNADLLVSEELAKILQLPAAYEMRSVGENLLKGRLKTMEIFSISAADILSNSRQS